MPYFPGVEATVLGRLKAHGSDARLHTVTQLPTSSLAARAARLGEAVAAEVAEDETIHLIGHSTGGLDCRLLSTPGASLPTTVELEPLVRRIRTVVTVSTPHHGTPLASFFASVQGHRLLRVLSMLLARVLRFGKQPIRGALAISRAVVLLDKLTGLDDSLLEHLHGRVLAGMSDEHRGDMQRLLDEVGDDQRLIEQLAPVSIELFNAGACDRPGVRYGCVVTRGPRPKVTGLLRGLRDPYAQLSRVIYLAMHRASSSLPRERQAELTQAQARALIDAFGLVPGAGDSDGIVPTLSQVRGRVIAAVHADHLDAMGYYAGGVDWLMSGSNFQREAFEALWERVASFIADD